MSFLRSSGVCSATQSDGLSSSVQEQEGAAVSDLTADADRPFRSKVSRNQVHKPVLLFDDAAVEVEPLVMLVPEEEEEEEDDDDNDDDEGTLPVLPCSLPCSFPCFIPCSIYSFDVAVAMISRTRGCRGVQSGPRDERSTRNCICYNNKDGGK